MGIKVKVGKTYTPDMQARLGVDMTNGNYYGVIDRIHYDKESKSCNFSVDIYGTQDSRDNDGTVVDRVNFNFNGDKFDSEIGNDGLNVPQAYTKSLETLTDWETDE